MSRPIGAPMPPEWLREHGVTAERVMLAAGPSPRNPRANYRIEFMLLGPTSLGRCRGLGRDRSFGARARRCLLSGEAEALPVLLQREHAILCVEVRAIEPSALGHPVGEQRIRDRQHHRPDEEPDDAESDEPSDHAREDQQQRQVGAALDQQRPQEVVERHAEDRPDEEDGPHTAPLLE